MHFFESTNKIKSFFSRENVTFSQLADFQHHYSCRFLELIVLFAKYLLTLRFKMKELAA